MLGRFRVSVGPRIVDENRWRLKKAAGLVKLLALAPYQRMHRERMMELLWPDLEAEAATNNLHRTLHSARRTLEPKASAAGSRYLRLRGDQLELCPEGSLWVDAEAFEEAAAAARRARDPAAYRAAVDLYAGELLPGDRYEAWAEDRRQGLRLTYLSLLLKMAGLHEEREDYEPAIEALGRVVAEEPAHEAAHAGLMRLYALSGRRDEALKQYERLGEDLRRGFAGEPSAAIRCLHKEILADRLPPTHPPGERPTEDVDGDRRHNLPAAQSSFVGRERETLEVKRALALTRLLTLTGAGGCGKTRLALEVARDLVGAYPDGVWLVELASLSDPALVPNAVAVALEVRERPDLPLAATLADFLGPKRMLLVLDNCEHLIDACARLVDTPLSSCKHLRVLATSREPLGVAGEANWLVPSLTLPDAGRLPSVGNLTRNEPVGLFVERARSRLPAFALTPANARAVVEVCRRLDGIPLAIELATARMGALAVEQIAERLEDSLGLLTTGSRTAAPRQRTHEATLAWS
jgi:DNA-binding SARP family transcriptional activator